MSRGSGRHAKGTARSQFVLLALRHSSQRLSGELRVRSDVTSVGVVQHKNKFNETLSTVRRGKSASLRLGRSVFSNFSAGKRFTLLDEQTHGARGRFRFRQ